MPRRRFNFATSPAAWTTYLLPGELTPAQFEELAAERQPGSGLVPRAISRLEQARNHILAIAPAEFSVARHVGRARIPTTAIGLAIHIAEHTQRHVGQLLVTCRALRAAR